MYCVFGHISGHLQGKFCIRKFWSDPRPLVETKSQLLPIFFMDFLHKRHKESVVFLRIICCLNTVPEGPHGHSHRSANTAKSHFHHHVRK